MTYLIFVLVLFFLFSMFFLCGHRLLSFPKFSGRILRYAFSVFSRARTACRYKEEGD